MEGTRCLPAAMAAVMILLAMAAAADAYVLAQFATTRVRNELGSRSSAHLKCYRRVEDKKWGHKKPYRWVLIYEKRVGNGDELVMMHPGLPFVREAVACELIANKQGGICSWTTFDDDTDPADKIGDDRTWYLQPEGIYDEITTPGPFQHGRRFRYRYCRAFRHRDLIHRHEDLVHRHGDELLAPEANDMINRFETQSTRGD